MIDDFFLLRDWLAVHRRLQLPKRLILREYWALRRLYQGGRYYHTWHHVSQTIRWLRDNSGVSRSTDLVAMALFYHDAVYRVGARDNEEASAVRWESYGGLIQAQNALGWRDCALIGGLIRMTASHKLADDHGPEMALMCDADMSIFIDSPATYMEYARDIWREYREVGRDAYLAGRLKFLEGLDPKEIFHTDAGRAQWDRAAGNIAWEIDALRNNPDVLLG